jgi:ABC-type amino acid transport system permease subunit
MKSRADRVASLLLQLNDGPQWAGISVTAEQASLLACNWATTCIAPEVKSLFADDSKRAAATAAVVEALRAGVRAVSKSEQEQAYAYAIAALETWDAL